MNDSELRDPGGWPGQIRREQRCPVCGGPILVSQHFHSWACADSDCVLMQSDGGPGGGYPLPPTVQAKYHKGWPRDHR